MRSSSTLPNLVTRKLRVGGRDISFSEVGVGPVVFMLHGGGPGASGVSNYSRNIETLSKSFRLVIPDMPGYGLSTKGLDRKDPSRVPRRPNP